MAGKPLPITEADLRQWRLIEVFRLALDKIPRPEGTHSSFEDPRRRLLYADYLSLMLFGLFNPVVKTMRAICSVSQWKQVQSEVGGRSVSLGSFSAAQHLVDPAHLERVFADLLDQVHSPLPENQPLDWQQWFARNSSVFAALTRMAWALYSGGRAGFPHKALRLHLNFNVLLR